MLAAIAALFAVSAYAAQRRILKSRLTMSDSDDAKTAKKDHADAVKKHTTAMREFFLSVFDFVIAFDGTSTLAPMSTGVTGTLGVLSTALGIANVWEAT
jgi:hypothetical protein